MSEIELDGLTKRYGDIVAVDDIDASFTEGDYTMVLGPSGSGKSTVLRMIAGLESPTAGDVRIDDETVTDASARERDLSMVFQSLALWDHKTVEENMAFGLRMEGVDNETRRERVEETAELLEIEDNLDESPQTLSGGQQQRVALGRSLVRQPDAILLDEPLSSLDEQLRLRMRTELRRIQHETDTTFIHVTHSQEDAMTVADEILLLKDGETQQFADPLELYHEPANEFVADFIGTPTMNLKDAEFDGANRRFRLPGFDVSIPERLADRLADRADSSQLRVGMRPESLSFTDDGASQPTFDATVTIVETLGDHNWYYLDTTDGEFVVNSAEESVIRSVDEGDDVTVAVDTESLHVFDPQTTERLL